MKHFLLLTILLSFGSISAQSTASFFKKANDVFSTYVIDSKVNYSAIQQDPQLLNDAIAEAKDVRVSTSSPKTYQAFWINTYNLLTIKGIVNNYPVSSPMDVSGFFDKITYNVGGKTVTLNQIENELLRANFPNEPRFHFVLVCAAQSCPPILNKAYSPNYLDGQLEQQTKLAINNPTFLKVNGDNVQFSKIMDWYNEDFTRNGQTLVEFTNKYRRDKLPANAKTSFYEYNWSLNETKKKITKVSTGDTISSSKPSTTDTNQTTKKKAVPETSTITSDGKEDAMKKEGTEKATAVSTSTPKNNAVDSESATKTKDTSEVVVTAVPKPESKPETPPKTSKDTLKISYDNVGENDAIKKVAPDGGTTTNKPQQETQDQSNIRKYTPSKLIGKGEFDIKFFNNLYTQTKFANEDGDVIDDLPRQTFFTSTLEVYTGISDNNRINVGGILRFRSNTIGDRNALEVFQFDGERNTARSGLTAIAPSIKFTPLANVGNFSIQSSLFIPLIDNEVENGVFFEQKGFQWQNRLFYDYTFPGEKFQLFTELNVEYNFGEDDVFNGNTNSTTEGSFANNSLSLFPGVFLSYFPSNDFTVLGLVQHFQRFDISDSLDQDFTALGGGIKYQLTEALNAEALYTNFVRGTSNGLGQTFNLGLRAIF